MLRTYVDWCNVASGGPNSRDWTNAEALFSAVSAHNAANSANKDIRVTLMLLGSPSWANAEQDDVGCGAQKGVAAPPEDTSAANAAWESFVRAVLDRYGHSADNGLFAIEIWNEPNLPEYWGSDQKLEDWNGQDASRFAQLVNRAGSALDASGLRGQVKLFPGGLSPTGKSQKNYGSDAFRAISTVVNGISMHFYANYKKTARKAAERIKADYQDLKDALTAGGLQDKDRWITEIGFPAGKGGDSNVPGRIGPPDQAERLAEAFLRYGQQNIIKGFIVHRLRDDPHGNEKIPFGVRLNLTSRRPAYCRLARLVADPPDDPVDSSCSSD
jgi:hypothetical protein